MKINAIRTRKLQNNTVNLKVAPLGLSVTGRRWVLIRLIFFYPFFVIFKILSSFFQCSVTCGVGIRTRGHWCQQGNQVIGMNYCNPNTMPKAEEQCTMPACTTWEYSDWQPVKSFFFYFFPPCFLIFSLIFFFLTVFGDLRCWNEKTFSYLQNHWWYNRSRSPMLPFTETSYYRIIGSLPKNTVLSNRR